MAALAIGCNSARPCREGTVFATLSYDAPTSRADQITVSVRVGSTTALTTKVHKIGSTEGSLEITFGAGYPTGQTIRLDVVALEGGSPIGSGHAEASLDGKCTPLDVTLSSTPGDGALADSTASDFTVMDPGPDIRMSDSLVITDTVAADGMRDQGIIELGPGEDRSGASDLTPDSFPQPDLTSLPDLTVSLDVAAMSPPSDMAIAEAAISDAAMQDLPLPDLATPDLVIPPDLTKPSATCVDGLKNQNETDTDCGGSCGGCAANLACKVATDCQSLICGNGKCQMPPIVASHVPIHHITDGTCDLTVHMSIDTGKGEIDGKAPPPGCPFVAEKEAGKLDVLVLAVRRFTVNSGETVRVTGPRPLVVVASGPIAINGTLDGGGRSTVPGAGGALAGNGTGVGGDGGVHGGDPLCHGGGGGAGYGSAGALGGQARSAVPGEGGAIYSGNDPFLVMMVPGGSGGGGRSCNGCGPKNGGGGGGGSIQLTAGGGISIGPLGVVNAGGGGGLGGGGATSGAGGASGGAIFLEAPSITVSQGAGATANGGGGGAGFDLFNAKGGANGQDGSISGLQASGGVATGSGLKGGDGASLAGAAGVGAGTQNDAQGNGGGGGGGYGRIVVRSRGAAMLLGVVSPPPALDSGL